MSALLGVSKSHRQQKTTVLVVCGGRKTEKIYFDAIKRQGHNKALTVPACNDKSCPVLVVKKAIHLRGLGDYDHVWCVIDVETHAEATKLNSALTLAGKNSIKVALSNKCFEYWLLLHYDVFTKTFTKCDKYKAALKNLNSAYEKNRRTVISKLAIDSLRTAIKNATTLEKTHGWQGNVQTICPSTNVHELVDLILN